MLELIESHTTRGYPPSRALLFFIYLYVWGQTSQRHPHNSQLAVNTGCVVAMLPTRTVAAARACLRVQPRTRCEGVGAVHRQVRAHMGGPGKGLAHHGGHAGYDPVDPQPMMPSLNLPAYFELREVGRNFRFKTDPEWVLDVIHQDCVREEGLTYVPASSSYSVTFFQLVNYCAKRGFEVVSFGRSADGASRWTVLHSKELHQLKQASAPPPHVAHSAAVPTRRTDAELERGIGSGKYVKWGDQLVPTERKLSREDFAFYDADAPGRVGTFKANPEPLEAVVVTGEEDVVEPANMASVDADVRATVQEHVAATMKGSFAHDNIDGRNSELLNKYVV